jgi:hypothetical protein
MHSCSVLAKINSVETVVLSDGIEGAEEPGGSYERGKIYKKLLEPENRRRTKVRISKGVDVRLGGRYLMDVELTRQEISRLFFETHNGAMIRMIKSFIDEENAEDRAEELTALREQIERHKRIAKEIAAAEAEAGDPS